MNKELPQFLCIGAQKAATSWLNETLKHHPQIWLPPVKELHYFDHKFVQKNRSWTQSHIESGVKQVLYWYCKNMGDKSDFSLEYIRYLMQYCDESIFTEDWYIDLFQKRNGEGLVKGDITPEYSTIPEEGVEYVQSLLGNDLKVIYIVRDPVSRAVSQLKMHIDRSNTNVDEFTEEEWLSLLDSQIDVIKNRGDYKTYIPRWRAKFKDNLMLIPYKQISNEPTVTINSICSFLNIKENAIDKNLLSNRVHKTKSVQIPKLVYSYLEKQLKDQIDFINEDFDSNDIKYIL